MHNQPKEPQPYEDCQAKSIQEFGWSSQGMDWGWGQGIKSHHTQSCRGIWLFGYSNKEFGCRQRSLTWAKEKNNWTVAQWSKVLFSDESKFCISFGNQGPRVWRKGGEAHIAQVAWRPVLSFHSLWWFGVQCHLLVLVHFVFWKSTSLHPFTKTFWSTSCFLLLTSFLKMLISFSSRMWHLPTAKSSKSWLNDHDVGVLDWSANSPVLIPTENLWGIVKRKKRPKNADKLKATVKETGASIPPEQFHKLISSMPRWIEEEELFICHTHTIIQSITSSEMCCLHLTHPSAHNWSSGQQTLQRTGSSSVPCSRISHQSWTIPAGAEIRTHNLRLQVWCSIH